ncbi:MAG: hypothetical protein COA78_00210 [Blastopirellula sp.]|nr:MAG: hypothetical protein COA78_00210 [Blastopirellula sp.]
MLFATALLGACERYTEQTYPCFDRNGTPVVSRAALSFTPSDNQPIATGKASVAVKASVAATANVAATGCTFEDLPRPE